MGHRLSSLTTVVVVLLGVFLGAAPSLNADEDEPVIAAPATLTVIGARVQPIRIVDAKPKAWDADHGAVPDFVYRLIGTVTGFPPIAVLGVVPYRNRPDPFVVVHVGEEEWGRSRPMQGAFAPTWLLTVGLPTGDADVAPVLTFEVFDDDLKDDDRIGKAMIETEKLLAQPGRHVLEGTGGLHDLTLVVRNPAAPSAGEEAEVTIDRVQVTVREKRPALGDWDAGGNPLRGRMPKRLPLPEKFEGLDKLRPDLRVTLDWGGGGTRSSEVVDDAFLLDWKDLAWPLMGRAGIGDGLYVRVDDMDVLVADPVGVVYLPWEELLAAKEKGVLVVEPDEMNGIERLEITFSAE